MTRHTENAGRINRERNHKKIVELRNEGFSYDDIASRLGVSRGMVAGVLHRVRQAEGKPPAPVGRPKKIVPPKVVKQRRGRFPFLPSTPRTPPRQIDLKAMKNEPVPIGERQGGCQWMHGDPSERLFCGHDRKDGSSYCQHHHARAFTVQQSGKGK